MEEFSFIGRIRSLTLESARLDTILPGEEEQRFPVAKIYFDDEGRPLKKQERSSVTLYEYDENGNCTKEIFLNQEGRVIKEILSRYNLDRKLQEESGSEKKSFHYNGKGLIDYTTSFANGLQESISSFHYNEKGQLIRTEIRDPEGQLLRSCRYERNQRGLVKEEIIINQDNLLLEHNYFEYSAFYQENWLKRIRYTLDNHGEKIPVEVLYRGISLPSSQEIHPAEPIQGEQFPEISPAQPEKSERLKKRIEFENGTYTGFVNEEDIPHGKGEFSGKDGSYYKGRFGNGLMAGLGDMITADGRHYIGEFRRNLPHGEGECLWPDGSRYRGSFRMGEMHGIGVFIWPDGSRFTGLFDNNNTTDQGLFESASDRERKQ